MKPGTLDLNLCEAEGVCEIRAQPVAETRTFQASFRQACMHRYMPGAFILGELHAAFSEQAVTF